MIKTMRMTLSLCLALALLGGAAAALAVESVVSGNWDEGGTWSGGVVPAAADPVVIKGGHTVTIRTNGVNQVGSLVVEDGGVLTHLANSTTALGERYKVVLQIAGDLTVAAGGAIDVSAKGYAAVHGPGRQTKGTCSGSHGGKGYPYSYTAAYEVGPTYGSIIAPTNCGSGGSYTGGGGAAVLTVGGTTTLNGVIAADGAAAADHYSGSGGSLFLTTGQLTGSGVMRVNGGAAPSTRSGGGGRLAVILSASSDFGAVRMESYPGTSKQMHGAGGTVYLERASDAAGQGRLVVDYGGIRVGNIQNSTIQNELAGASYAFSEIVLTNGAVYLLDAKDTLDIRAATIHGDPTTRSEGIFVNGGALLVPDDYAITNIFVGIAAAGSLFAPASSLTVGTNATLIFDVPWEVHYPLTIADGGWLSHSANGTTADGEKSKLCLTVNGALTVEAGGMVNVDGKGYESKQGPGYENNAAGSHGGMGSRYSLAQVIGPTYGSLTRPANIGSGGASWPGGGAVKLTVAGIMTLDGVISANGGGGANYGGAGGSVLITCAALAGNGTISANGGGGNPGGGGGRVALILTESDTLDDLTVEAFGGLDPRVTNENNKNHGAPGTIYFEMPDDAAGRGTLVVDANNVMARAVSDPNLAIATKIGSLVSDTAVGTVIITNQALLMVEGQTLEVYGDWLNHARSGSAAGGAVTLAGATAATVSGNNGFYDLICTNESKTILFADGKTNTVAGALTLANVTLDSVSGSGLWYIEASANLHSIAKVTVGRSDARPGAPLTAFDSISLGDNHNWTFADSGSAENVWLGSIDSDWFKPGNWSQGRSTIPSDAVVIPPGCPHYPTLDFNRHIAALAVSNGATLNLGGYGLEIDGETLVAGAMTAIGTETLTLKGAVRFSDGIFNAAACTVVLTGTNGQSVIAAGNAFHRLEITASDGKVTFDDDVVANTIINRGSELEFGGNVTAAVLLQNEAAAAAFGGTVTAGELINHNAPLTFAGIVTADLLASHAGDLSFNGTVTVAVFTNWYGNLTFADDVAAGDFFAAPGGFTVSVAEGKELSVANLELYGRGTHPLLLRGPAGGGVWQLKVRESSVASHVDVAGSDASGGLTVEALVSVDSGGNANWLFAAGWQTWVGGASSLFTNAHNWLPPQQPSSGSRLFFDGYHAAEPIISGVVTAAQVMVGDSLEPATLTVNGHLVVDGDVTVLRHGTITHAANDTTAKGEMYKLRLTVGGDLKIATGGAINLDSKGYKAGQGPGSGACGSHGGNGSVYYDYQRVGKTYGSITAPTTIGSGGMSRPGGGAAHLRVVGTTTLNGAITATGGEVIDHYSGAGGAVYLTTGILTGSGLIGANGGEVTVWSAASGGGGRVAVVLTAADDFGAVTIKARQGPGGNKPGAAGTVYLQRAGEADGEGTLLVDNHGAASASAITDWRPATVISDLVTDAVVGTVIITNMAILKLADNQTLTAHGDWRNHAAFSAGAGSVVELAGTAAALVVGDNAFHDLTATNAAKTLVFEAGKETAVAGTLRLGARAGGAPVALRSTVAGVAARLTLATEGSQQIRLVDVQDSDASGGQTLVAGYGSVNLGNNTNWRFRGGTVLLVK